MAEVAELIEALSDPDFYPHKPESVEVRELVDTARVYSLAAAIVCGVAE